MRGEKQSGSEGQRAWSCRSEDRSRQLERAKSCWMGIAVGWTRTLGEICRSFPFSFFASDRHLGCQRAACFFFFELPTRGGIFGTSLHARCLCQQHTATKPRLKPTPKCRARSHCPADKASNHSRHSKHSRHSTRRRAVGWARNASAPAPTPRLASKDRRHGYEC